MASDLQNVFSASMLNFAFPPQELMVSCKQGFGLHVCRERGCRGLAACGDDLGVSLAVGGDVVEFL